MKNLPIKVSFFLHRWETRSTVITMDEFLADIRGPRWKVLVQAHRDFLRRGLLKEAADIKDNMPGITAAGICKGGHADANLRQLSQLMMLDFDHTGQQTHELITRLQALPYVVATFISISGEGVKALVRTGVANVQQYATAYAVVAAEVSKLTGFACDMMCRNPARLCYATWDEEAYYNPAAEPFGWQEAATVAATVQPAANTRQQPGADSAAPFADEGFMVAFLNDFARRNTFARGGRHDFMLKLGRIIRYKGFSLSEFDVIRQLAAARFSESDYSVAEGERDLTAGYQYVIPRNPPFPQENRVHWAQGSPSAPPRAYEPGEDEEELSAKSEELREQAPYFPDEIFDRLPNFLHTGVSLARSRRERDMLLMGMLANISGCLPGVRMLYDQLYCSPHLYFVAIAHAGTGKGVLALAACLPDAINEHYLEENKRARREYDEALLRWEMEQKAAGREKRMANLDLRPEEPRKICLKLSPNLSKSQLIISLEENGPLGVIINAPELDMVSNAMRQDCGKHDDVFRAAFQHEEVSSYYKIDHRQITVHEPHLAFCFAGTPAQLIAFIISLENGMYSRVLFYTMQTQWQWRSAAPRKSGSDLRTLFRGLSERLLEMHFFLLQSPTEVVFTPAQWAEHTRRFGALLTGVVSEKDDTPGAIVLRHGLMAARIASVLTALRKCECAWSMPEYTCTDDDFHTAMQITEVLLEHSLLLSTSLPGNSNKPRPLQAFFRIRPVLEHLTNRFTFTEFVNEAAKEGVPLSTAKRLLAKVVKLLLVEKEGDVYRKTRREWPEG